jgi:hypothetical protein
MVLKARARMPGLPILSIVQIALLALISLTVTGCDESKNPLEKPKEEVVDKDLLGLWRGTQEGHDVYLHIVAEKPPMMKAVVITYPLNDYHVGVSEYEMYPTITAAHKFLNVEVPSDKDKHEMAYWFAKYNFSADGKLTIMVPDYDGMDEAVKSHKLTGKAWTSTWTSNVELDDSSPRLLSYFDARTPSGDDIAKYKPFGTFHRVIEKEAN